MNKLAIHEISSPLPLMGILAKGKMIKVVKNLSLSLSLSLSVSSYSNIVKCVCVIQKGGIGIWYMALT
jgi:hypothetical protein